MFNIYSLICWLKQNECNIEILLQFFHFNFSIILLKMYKCVSIAFAHKLSLSVEVWSHKCDRGRFVLICVSFFVLLLFLSAVYFPLRFFHTSHSPSTSSFNINLSVSLTLRLKYMSINVIKHYMLKILMAFFGLMLAHFTKPKPHIWRLRVRTCNANLEQHCSFYTMLMFYALC